MRLQRHANPVDREFVHIHFMLEFQWNEQQWQWNWVLCTRYCCKHFAGRVETGWDLGPFAVMLQCLHLDKPLLQQQNTKKLYGTKNNCLHVQLGQIMDKKIQKTKKLNCHFWRARSKSRVLRMPPALNTTRGVGRRPKLPLWPKPWTHPYPHPI